MKNETDIVEILLYIVIVIFLFLLFKEQLISLIENLLLLVNEQFDEVMGYELQ